MGSTRTDLRGNKIMGLGSHTLVTRQWYFKFDQVIKKFGFKENEVENCIYAKFSGSNFVFLILYIDDILLANHDNNFLVETKKFLSSN
jgi:hypothetical protein